MKIRISNVSPLQIIPFGTKVKIAKFGYSTTILKGASTASKFAILYYSFACTLVHCPVTTVYAVSS